MTPHRWTVALLLDLTADEARTIATNDDDTKRVAFVAQSLPGRAITMSGPGCDTCETMWMAEIADQPCPGDSQRPS